MNLTGNSKLKAAMERIKNKAYVSDTKRYICEFCKDTGAIAITHDGKEIPMLDAAGQIRVKVCKCVIEKQMQEKLKCTGLNMEEYKNKSFETFKCDTEEAQKMYKLAKSFLKDSEAKGIGFWGNSGTGKTHICIAICNELLKKGISHKYFNYRRDIQRLIALRFKEEEYIKVLDEFLSAEVLYIDDLFKLSQNNDGTYNKQELQIMFDIINTRYLNKKITIFSSELTVSEITKIDKAIGSRIFEIVDPYGLKLEGTNRRFKVRETRWMFKLTKWYYGL